MADKERQIGMIRSYIYWSNRTNNILYWTTFQEAHNGVQLWAYMDSEQRALLTNNGYWYKDNKADGRILTMSTRVNGEGLTQRTVLLLQWDTETARCPVQQCLFNQGCKAEGRVSLQLLHDSRTTANVKMLQSGLRECRKSHDNYQYV